MTARLTDDEVRALMERQVAWLPFDYEKQAMASTQQVFDLCEEVLDLRAKLRAAEELMRPREQ